MDHHSIWIIITGSGSSLDLDHHLIWIITTGSSSLDHYLIWIITGARSSSHIECHLIWIVIKSGSSHLDHNQVWIIIICYLIMVLSRLFSSQEVLQSQYCRPTLHVGLHQHLYLTLKSEWPSQLLHLTSACQKGTPNTHI